MLPVEVKALTKTYGKQTVVDDLTFSVSSSSIFGLLGPNGAGKTTTIKMLTGLIRPSGGMIKILGRDLSHSPIEIKRQIGHVYANMAFYPWLTARENLLFFGRFYGMGRRTLKERIEEMLDFVGLVNERQKQVGQYSQGMKQRLGIAKALIHSPSILFFDEATSGVDVEGINEIRRLMYELRRQEKTLIIASHRLDEIELVCNEIAILDRGRLLAYGSPGEIRDRLRGALFKYLVSVTNPLGQIEGEGVTTWFLGNGNVVLSEHDLLATLQARFGAEAVSVVAPTLEEAFLWMLKRSS